MAYNKDLDLPPTQDISNDFAESHLLSCSSFDLKKYNCEWLKAKVIYSSIFSDWGYPDACSRKISITLNHKEIASILVVTGPIWSKQYANAIT